MLCERDVVSRMTNRDLRRTWKTLAGKAGISKDIRDRIQNHSLHDVSSKHYDRWNYLTEKRDAMNRWDMFVRELIARTEAERAKAREASMAEYTHLPSIQLALMTVARSDDSLEPVTKSERTKRTPPRVLAQTKLKAALKLIAYQQDLAEWRRIADAMVEFDNDLYPAARAIGMAPRTLHRKLKKGPPASVKDQFTQFAAERDATLSRWGKAI